MTNPTNHAAPETLLAPLARGLMRRTPDILALSIHDARGSALWSSGDFLLAEDHALIAEVVTEPHDVRGNGCVLWWESADTARARCALPLHEGEEFCGVLLVVFSGLTLDDEGREERVNGLMPVLPVLAKETYKVELARDDKDDANDTTIVSQLKFIGTTPEEDEGLACDIEALGREQRLLSLIDHALKQDEFALHLQPIVSLREDDDATEKNPLIVEVLIRLPTAEFGVLSSHEFLETAERNGRMPAIDRWVIRALLVWMQRNRDRWADAKAVFSVNLSGKSVVRPDFRDYLEHCLDKSGLPLESLRFEVAELDAGLAPQEFAKLAKSLAERGCEVTVDNAGTGSGHYEFLREVNADILKIDGSLVEGAHDDIVSRALINGLVHMADTLGMRTIASQVDTTSKLRAVKQLGVDFAQGYQMRVPEDINSFEFFSAGAQRAPSPAHA
ncbi:MAG TPA: EAL domain-containing protein [Steroidobacteraceae bacterium]|nr:EAL domain-containing protein [Steroidobacteraceae bacterium]